jgi:translation elongation factor EF-Ts
MLSAEKGLDGKGGYDLEWCVAALEAETGDLEKARGWLKGFALQRNEVH